MKGFIKNKIPVSISISPQLLIRIDEAIQNEEMSRSDFIRTAIVGKLQELQEFRNEKDFKNNLKQD